MTALAPEVRRAAEPACVGGFEIGYVTDDGLEQTAELAAGGVGTVVRLGGQQQQDPELLGRRVA